MHPMSGRSSGRLGFKPDIKERTKTSHKQKGKKVSGENKVFTTSCRFRMTTPLRFLRCVGEKVATALRYLSFRRRRRSSPEVCSLGRSNPSIAPLDAYRAEAINDCIEFINKSSSLQRTKSAPPKAC